MDLLSPCAVQLNDFLAYNPGAVLLGPEDLPQLGSTEEVLAAISKWHVCQRSGAIRIILLATHGGMWCDVDCIPQRPFQHFARRTRG